ncbi:arabinose 5-phosphate isomerase KdsD [Abditibacteriota bacterium]|nr:arabinose 5-phosphate isomerase KdsD [Abditibacteriota bacterium]
MVKIFLMPESRLEEAVSVAQRVLELESGELSNARQKLGSDVNAARDWTRAVELVLGCSGRVVVTGLGKSGAVGRKIASTLASTGTPALFLHAGEAMHGDLGMVASGDCVLAISYSGRTEEILRLVPPVKEQGVPIIAFTASRQSPLGAVANCTVEITVEREACPLNLAPTSSTTLCLALGDALAVCLMEARGFGSSDFLRFHPGGSLGHGLALSVSEVMRRGDQVALCRESATLRQALNAISGAVAGAAIVVDETGTLCGYLTDGDVRRALLRCADAGALLETRVDSLMIRSPLLLRGEMTAREALRLFGERRINDAPVVDNEEKPIGWLEESDLLRAGVI